MDHFCDLQLRGLDRGYYADPTKSILVVAERNVPQAKEHFIGMGIQLVTWSRYLGEFVGEREAEASWTEEKVEGWAESVRTLSGVARKHPQSRYAGLQKSPNRSGHSCSGSPQELTMPLVRWRRRSQRRSSRNYSREWEMDHQGGQSPA